MYGQYILCGISKVSFEIPHKIYNPYTERCESYSTVKIWLVSSLAFLKWPKAYTVLISTVYTHEIQWLWDRKGTSSIIRQIIFLKASYTFSSLFPSYLQCSNLPVYRSEYTTARDLSSDMSHIDGLVQEISCISNGVTSFLHWSIDMMYQ